MRILLQCVRQFHADRCRPIQSAEFYAKKGLERIYYYVVDTRGQLFLESTPKHTIATCLKDKAFLKFFFRQLRRNLSEEYLEFPYVSPCGKEINLVTPQDPVSPLVFTGLDPTEEILEYASGTLQESFSPGELAMNLSTLRMYHPLKAHKYLRDEVGLIHPHLCQQFASHIKSEETTDGNSRYFFIWKGSTYPLKIFD